jgi:circadian clock protein KaiC
MSKTAIARTGVRGLDDILGGGLTTRRGYLLEGSPGTGKTTLAMHFLMEGVSQGESALFVTLSETEEELQATAVSHGWNLHGIKIRELLPPDNILDEDQQQSLLYSSDLELGETTREIFAAFDKVKPNRVAIDSLSEIRLLSQSSLRYRRQILAMKHFFAQRQATVLFLDDLTTDTNDATVHSIAHGVIRLEELAPNYGAQRRRLRVIKYRAQNYRGGYHDFIIETGGLRVFPRLISSEHKSDYTRDLLRTNIVELDQLLGGGVERGSSVLLLGPAGSGKSFFTLAFVVAAVERGETCAMFIFDEELGILDSRAKGLGIDLSALVDSKKLILEQVDAAELSPGEFSHRVRSAIQEQGARTIVIDSLNGYQSAMPEEQQLILHMHELLQFSNRQGATTFLTVAQHGVMGEMRTPVDLTYLADTVVLLRYFEALGRVRRAISVMKKRTSAHENTIREYQFNSDGIHLGEPLTEFQGVLRGVPRIVGVPDHLLKS